MNIKEIASKLIALRERMSAFIMSGELREQLGYEGYGEALRRHWITPDQEGSGMITLTNNLGTVAEMRQLAEEFVKEEGKECMFCHKKDGECTCKKCPDCGKANCACESLRETALLAQAHAQRSKLSLREIATMGLGNPDRLGTQPAQPNVGQTPAPNPPASTTAAPPVQQPMNVGANVRVVQDGKTYVGRVSAVNPDGKFQISFGPDRPAVDRTYDKTEVTPVADAPK
jgi:hypothetical protein